MRRPPTCFFCRPPAPEPPWPARPPTRSRPPVPRNMRTCPIPHLCATSHHDLTHAPHLVKDLCSFFSSRRVGPSPPQVTTQARHGFKVSRSARAVCHAHVAGDWLRHTVAFQSVIAAEVTGVLDADDDASQLLSVGAAARICSNCTRSSSLSVLAFCFKRRRLRSAFFKSF